MAVFTCTTTAGLVFLLLLIRVQVATGQDEDARCPTFVFQERLLEKTVRLEHKMEILMENVDKTVRNVAAQQAKSEKTKQKMAKEMNAMRRDFETLQTTQIARIDDVMQRQAAVVSKLSENVQMTVNTSIERIKEQTLKPSILFSAQKSSLKTVSPGTTLIFTDVLANTGKGYNPSTGVFTAPQDGVYIVSAQICNHSNKWIAFKLVAGGTTLSVAGGMDQNSYGCTTSTSFVHVQAGTEVMVNCSSGSRGDVLYDADDFSINMFSGMLVH